MEVRTARSRVGCNIRARSDKTLSAGVADDDGGRRCLRGLWLWRVHDPKRFIPVQFSGGQVAVAGELRFFAPARRMTRIKLN